MSSLHPDWHYSIKNGFGITPNFNSLHDIPKPIWVNSNIEVERDGEWIINHDAIAFSIFHEVGHRVTGYAFTKTKEYTHNEYGAKRTFVNSEKLSDRQLWHDDEPGAWLMREGSNEYEKILKQHTMPYYIKNGFLKITKERTRLIQPFFKKIRAIATGRYSGLLR